MKHCTECGRREEEKREWKKLEERVFGALLPMGAVMVVGSWFEYHPIRLLIAPLSMLVGWLLVVRWQRQQERRSSN